MRASFIIGGGIIAAILFLGMADLSPGGVSEFDAMRIANRIEMLGYACPRVQALARHGIDEHGNKTYRLSCGSQGPHYNIFVLADGSQHVRPVR